MKKVIFFLLALVMMSCEKEITPSNLLDGTYTVSYKVIIEPDGTEKIYAPIGSSMSGITGWMSETKLIFTDNSLGISQLCNEGWNTGYVKLERANYKPVRVGCHPVESVDETQISWYQDDIIIKHILIKD